MKNWIWIALMIMGLALTVHAQGVSVSSYNVDPSPVIPGQTFTLYGYVYNNTGVPAQNVQFELQLGADVTDTSFPFSIEPTDSLVRNIGTIAPYQTAQVKYQIRVDPSAFEGAYTINLRAFSPNDAGAILPVTINVKIRKPVLSIVNSTPTEVGIGNSSVLNVTIRNTGSSSAQNILLRLKEDRTVTSTGVVVERGIIPLGASSTYLDELAVGGVASFSIPILVDPAAISKPYFVPVTLEYYDSNKTLYTSTDYIGLKVSGEPELGLLLSETTPLPSPGKESRIVLDIFNTGLGPAKFITASVDADFLSFSPTQSFIGTIESDDFDSIILDAVVLPSTQSGEHMVNVTLSYKNEFGDPAIFTQAVPIRVYNASEIPNGNGGFDFTWIILLALIGGGYWWFKLRKPKNGK